MDFSQLTVITLDWFANTFVGYNTRGEDFFVYISKFEKDRDAMTQQIFAEVLFNDYTVDSFLDSFQEETYADEPYIETDTICNPIVKG